jgi:hypothetical protein
MTTLNQNDIHGAWAPLALLNIELQALTNLWLALKSGLFEFLDMRKYVYAAVVRLDESKSRLLVKLQNSSRHDST